MRGSLKNIFLFSKSNRPPTRPLLERDLKRRKRSCRLVDAGGREQPDGSVRLDQPHGALDEQRRFSPVVAKQLAIEGSVPWPASWIAAVRKFGQR